MAFAKEDEVADSWLAKARVAAGMTAGECADLLGLPEAEYDGLEDRPGGMTVAELSVFCRHANDDARSIVRSFLLPMTRRGRRG